MEIAIYIVRCSFGGDYDEGIIGDLKIRGLSAQDAADEARCILAESFPRWKVLSVCRSCEGEWE